MKSNSKRLLSFLLITCMLFTACQKEEESNEKPTNTPSAAPTVTQGAGNTTPNATPTPEPLDNVHGKIRTEFNDSLDLSDYPLTPNEVPADYEFKMEAEDAVLAGAATIYQNDNYSGGAYVGGQTNDEGDTITFNVDLEYSGFYNLNFRSHCGDSGRTNSVAVDGVVMGDIVCNGNGQIVDALVSNIYLEAGSHEISIIPIWGWTDFDYLSMTRSDAITEDIYNVTAELSNPNADERTQMLYKFLCDVYGKYSLTGNYAGRGRVSLEWSEIEAVTGENFAVMGMEAGDFDRTSIANSGGNDKNLGYAYDFYTNAGGIVQFCWHWHTPEAYVINDEAAGHYWWNSFYAEHTTIDLDKIMNGEDEAGHEALIEDMHAMATQLERLRDAGVPILWRPLHEASGGWFWWGDCEPESYIKLWQEMYDIFTNDHNLTNLIWMWNAQSPDWYPGDEYCDIVSSDIYQPERVYTSYAGTFTEVANVPGESKLVALSENGVVMDPDLVMQDNARWLFWGTWGDPYTLDGLYLNETYTEKDMLIKAYSHERTLTLDELPDLKNYPLD